MDQGESRRNEARVQRAVQALAVTVEGEPVAWERVGWGGGHSFVPKRTQDWQDLVGYTVLMALRAKGIESMASLGHAVEMDLEFVLPTFHKRNGRDINRRRKATDAPDLSNLTKNVEDALNRVAYRDDAQIVAQSPRKRVADDGEKPHVKIRLRWL